MAAASRSHRVVVFCATFPPPTDRPSSFALSESKRGRRENKKHSRFPWVTYFLFRRQADYRTFRSSRSTLLWLLFGCNGVFGN